MTEEQLSIVNLDEICRTCLKEEGEKISIYSHREIGHKRLSVKELLLLHTQLQEVDEELPANICVECVAQLELAHTFNSNVIESNNYLKSLFAAKNVTRTNSDLNQNETSDKDKRQSKRSCKKHQKAFSDNYLSTKHPKEIKILPKQDITGTVMINLASDALRTTANGNVILLQPTDNADFVRKQMGYELGLTSRTNVHVHACTQCPKQFISAKYLRMHQETYHASLKQLLHKCYVCDLKFDSEDGLKKHNLLKHFRSYQFMCDECPKCFKSAKFLEKHKRKMHAARDDVGSSKEVITTTELEADQQRVDSDDGSSDEQQHADGPVSCKLCNKTFRIYKHYRLHKVVHKANVCVRCNRGFPTKSEMVEHAASHDATRPYECAYCGKPYSSRAGLLQHHRLTHNIRERVYFCGLCTVVTEAYIDLSSLQQHLERHGGELKNSTGDAADEELDPAADPESTETIHYFVVDDNDGENLIEISAEQAELLVGGATMEASEVSEMEQTMTRGTFKQEDYVDGDVAIPLLPTTQDSVKLEPAEQVGATEELLRMEIMEGVEKKEDFETEETSESAAHKVGDDSAEAEFGDGDSSPMSSPIRDPGVLPLPQPPARLDDSATAASARRNSPVRRHTCQVCGAELARRYNLMRHMALAHKMFTIRCVFCKAKFNNMSLYEVHRMSCKVGKTPVKVDANETTKVNKQFRYPECPICHIKFARKQLMFAHLQAEHGEHAGLEPEREEYLCKICNKKLITRVGFSYHMRSHYGYPRHECPVCKKRFTARTTLKNHIACRHTDERPHLCSQCGRRFVSKDHLRKHLKLTHGGRRDFLCGQCGLTFQQSSHARQHMWVHTGVKPHACNYCAGRYSSKGSLKKHYYRMHNEEYSRELRQRDELYRAMERQERASRHLRQTLLVLEDTPEFAAAQDGDVVE